MVVMRKKSKDGYIKIRYPKDELENMIYSKMRKISHMLRSVFPNNCTRYVICDEIMNGIFEIKYIATLDADTLLKRKKILQIKSYGGITIHNYLFLCNKLNNYKR